VVDVADETDVHLRLVVCCHLESNILDFRPVSVINLLFRAAWDETDLRGTDDSQADKDQA
jgi:hypothetical protein